MRRTLAIVALAAVAVAGCATSEATTEPEATSTPAVASSDAEAGDSAGAAPATGPGVRTVPASEAATLIDDREVIVLDIRTPAEVAEARLPVDEVLNLDFYEPDFADQLASLDRDASYVMYCRSGNRSGTTRALLSQLGFQDVADVDGGIIGWLEAGLPVAE